MIFFTISRQGQLANQQVAGTLEHLLLTERQALHLLEDEQAFQHRCHIQQRAGTHAIGVLFETVFPVGGAVTVAVFQITENLLDFPVLYDRPQADIRYAVERNRNFEVAGFYVQEVIALDLRAQGAGADLLDDPNAVVGINNAVAYLKMAVAVTAHKGTDRGAKGTSLL